MFMLFIYRKNIFFVRYILINGNVNGSPFRMIRSKYQTESGILTPTRNDKALKCAVQKQHLMSL